ncbi:hypothetical protein A5N15_03520 [Rothia kristinae]|uniref:Polyprenol-phosphate-mannose-dependent alpha-(1-2)-phosphatidylinositol mannoside mannosyltransferase n=1 Tax=Rothia kristinae TaxID=37923 RepID=A0A657IV72_9MICC|nr:hypothetical protein A5N15_03520 [Rothia kristinae]
MVGAQLTYSMLVGGLDFSVYRTGAATIFGSDGVRADLYDRDLVPLGGGFLPFTYPPFAALILLPFAFIPMWLGQAIMLAFSVAVAWWFAAIVYDYVNHRGRRIPFQDKLGRTTTIAVLTAVILLSGPWRRGIGLVQINPLIMLLVLGDLLRPATRLPRGFFIGIAGGIKLTPLVFGLIPLMRKDVKGVLTLGASFLGTIALGFLLLPHQAVQFWTSAVSDPTRVGNINYPDNISVQGWLMHLTLEGYHAQMPTALLSGLHWLLIAVLLVGTAAVIPVLDRRGMRLSVIGLTAFLMLEMSPISWSHHNTWLPLIVAAFLVDALPWAFRERDWRRTAAQVLAWAAFVGLYYSPLWLAATVAGTTENLDYVSRPAQIAAGLPMLAHYLLVLLWITQIWRHRHDPCPPGNDLRDLWSGWRVVERCSHSLSCQPLHRRELAGGYPQISDVGSPRPVPGGTVVPWTGSASSPPMTCTSSPGCAARENPNTRCAAGTG